MHAYKLASKVNFTCSFAKLCRLSKWWHNHLESVIPLVLSWCCWWISIWGSKSFQIFFQFRLYWNDMALNDHNLTHYPSIFRTYTWISASDPDTCPMILFAGSIIGQWLRFENRLVGFFHCRIVRRDFLQQRYPIGNRVEYWNSQICYCLSAISAPHFYYVTFLHNLVH